MAPPSSLDKAKADRIALTDHLEFLETELTRHATQALNRHEVTMYLMELDETRKLLLPNHTQIRLALPATEDFNPYQQDYRRLSQMAGRVYSGLHGIKVTFPPEATASTSASTATPHQRSIKLPPLELPKFSGNLQEWVSFRDLFLTAIDKSSLTKVEKLTQLKSLLTGEAARQVRSLILSDANYDIAWNSLKDRYENNRELLFSILKRLISQPVMTASSAVGLRSLIDTTKECIRSLEVLALPTQHWDAILLYLLFSKLDPASRELWEQSLPDSSIPTLAKIYEFIEQRARALAASGGAPPPRHNGKTQQQPPVRSHLASSSSACKMECDQVHPIFRCPNFQKLDPYKRQEIVKKHNLCRNCLYEGHRANSCSSKYTCKICREKHHTMLHPNNSTVVGRQIFESPAPTTSTSAQGQVQSHHCNSTPVPTGILATARVKVHSSTSQATRRALVDCGSTNTQILKSTARRLKLQLRPVNIPMTGQGETFCGTARYVTTINYSPWFNESVVFSATALVVDKISGYIPSRHLPKDDWPHLAGLQQADPEFDQPDNVELLFGTDIAWNHLGSKRICGFPGQPLGIESSLGWLVGGANDTNPATSATSHVSTADLDYNLRRFFEQEEPLTESCQSKEEKACDAHFESTHKRDLTGRFIVKLPLGP